MSASTSASPPRPAGVPDAAYWQPNTRSWVLGDDDEQGRHHGRFVVYGADGLLRSELGYVEGELHGPFRRYHPDGALAREGRFDHGELRGQVHAYQGPKDSPEKLRSCCVPPGAVKMTAIYRGGRCHAEIFYDDKEQRLLADGSVHPERPQCVPRAARYLLENRCWEDGRRDRNGRQGRFRWWTQHGLLVEVADFVDNQRHGLWERRDEHGLIDFRHYQKGQLHGPCCRRLEADEYPDADFSFERGFYDAGLPAGSWTLLDGTGSTAWQVELGRNTETPFGASVWTLHANTTPPSIEASTELSELATLTQNAQQPMLARLLRLRAAYLTGDSGALQASARCAFELSPRAVEEHLKQLRQSEASPARRCAHVLCELAWRAPAALWLKELAVLSAQAPVVSRCLAKLASSFNPDAVELLAVQAHADLELGNVEAARAALAGLRERAPSAGTWLEVLDRAVFPTFEFWPAQLELDTVATPDLPTQVAQPLDALQQAISKSARRLSSIRHALDKNHGCGACSWLPPDLSHLHGPDSLTLEVYEFDAPSEEGATDRVVVDERVQLENVSITALMKLARLEWQTLCWLCYSSGLNEVAIPHTLNPPDSFAFALSTAFSRHFRAEDQLQTGGLRSRVHRLPAFNWCDVALQQLPKSALPLVRDDYREMRATLFFAADETCRSPWQDDLRG